ncbi:DUF202 domain-containing protein [Candidatus Kaiserbacteria bacterium]|nr:DUF202 domain-containing protein [Candidatus Kaiserbacteria bacterium]
MSEDAKLRDSLARDRTALANERTLLAYSRTALGLVALAVLVFKFASPDVAIFAAPLSLTAALFVMFWGLRSFNTVSKRLGKRSKSWQIAHKLGILVRIIPLPRKYRNYR